MRSAAVEVDSNNNMYRRARNVVPRLERTQHKGQSGRIGVVGGSAEYTGAPYYSAIAALRCGADLSWVFCGEQSAANPIKTYSPELIVFPSLSYLNSTLGRLSALVIGPGLGRDAHALKETAEAIQAARKANVPIVLDGDALWLLKDKPELIRGYRQAIITPNAMEFDRLHRAAFKDEPAPKIEWSEEFSTSPAGVTLSVEREPALSVAKVADWLEGVTVMRKGVIDIISDGRSAAGCAAFGSARRCGGQGDVLAGCSGVFLSWATGAASSSGSPDAVAAAYGASLLTRRANNLAFEKHGRSMTTPDLIHCLGDAVHNLYDDETSPWCSL
jgi:ATP-dependent NAD(P)H-hydrate dehydratase